MAIHVQHLSNVSKQATLLDGLGVSPLKWRVCGCRLNRFVHEGMNHISNVEVHLKTRSGNVNICMSLVLLQWGRESWLLYFICLLTACVLVFFVSSTRCRRLLSVIVTFPDHTYLLLKRLGL